MPHPSESVHLWRHTRAGPLTPDTDRVAAEEPLEIRIAGRAISITMRTPGHDDELAAGFLLSEGLISRRADIEHIRRCDQAAGALADVLVAPHIAVDFARLVRHVFVSSSCGVCGSATIDAVARRWPPLPSSPEPSSPGHTIAADTIHTLPDTLRRAQPTFDSTGGLHAAGLFDLAGNLLVAREDVGRHNAVDKVLGHCLLEDLVPLAGRVLVVSGRVSFEIVQKAVAAGVPIIVAVSAPSSLAIQLAQECNLTLVGFARADRFNVYTHPSRIEARTLL